LFRFAIVAGIETPILGIELFFKYSTELVKNDKGKFCLKVPSLYEIEQLKPVLLELQYRLHKHTSFNVDRTILPPKRTSVIRVRVSDKVKEDRVAINPTADGHSFSRHCYIVPTVANVEHDQTGMNHADVIVYNDCPVPVIASGGQIMCEVEELTNEELTILDPALHSDTKCQSLIATSLSKPWVHTADVSLVTATTQQVKAKDPNPQDLGLDEDGKPYFDKEDILEYKETVGAEALFPTEEDMGPSADPVDLIPFDKIDPKYHPWVRKLFVDKYPSLLARHPFDIGRNSLTLGKVPINLVGPVPKPQQIYYSNAADARIMGDIIQAMMKYGILTRAKNVSWGCPIFLVRRKSGQECPRLLTSICLLNDVAAAQINMLPNIQRLLETLVLDGVGMASSADISNGFYGLELVDKHRSRATILCQYGAFSMTRLPMGYRNSPGIFSDALYRALNVDPALGLPDFLPYSQPFMDDVPCLTPPLADEKATAEYHYHCLDKMLYRLCFHRFKLNAAKLQLFQTEARLLGYRIQNNVIRLEEKRLSKILKCKFPTTKREVQVWMGYLASIRPFCSLELSRCHATLTELVRQDKIVPEERHKIAFSLAKKILTSDPFIVRIPDNNKVKVLYTDASCRLFGAILFELDMEIEIVRSTQHFEHLQRLPTTSRVHEIMTDHGLNLWRSKKSFQGAEALLEVILDQCELLHICNFPKNTRNLRAGIMGVASMYPLRWPYEEAVKQRGGTWDEFRDFITQPFTEIWPLKLFLQAVAYYFERDLVILSWNRDEGSTVRKIEGTYRADHKPAMWMYVPEDLYAGESPMSLANMESNDFSKFTAHDQAKYDLIDMTQSDINVRVKELLTPKHAKQNVLRVIQYSSKIIPSTQVSLPIWELEAMSLIEALQSLRFYLTNVPAVVCIIDSRTAFFLFSPVSWASKVKSLRWSLLVRSSFPNIIMQLVSSQHNLSDLLSRVYTFDETVAKQFKIRNMEIPEIAELEGKLMSFEEVEEVVTANPQWGVEGAGSPDALAKIGLIHRDISTRTKNELENLDQFVDALRILGDRLSNDQVSIRQREEMPNMFKQKTADLQALGYSIESGLLYKDKKLYIPESMEGLLCSFCHLFCGHSGVTKTQRYASKLYYFPQMMKKIAYFVSRCHICLITNPHTGRKLPLGVRGVPSKPFSLVFIDLLENVGTKNDLGIDSLLVISDFLTKNIYLYPLSAKTSNQVLRAFQIFLQHCNAAVETLVCDNAPILRSEKFLTFMTSLGIRVAPTIPHFSSGRGYIETCVRLSKFLLRKLVASAKSYDISNVFWLCSILLNNSYAPSIDCCPSELVHASNSFSHGPLGISGIDGALNSRLLNPTLRKTALKIRKLLEARVKVAREHLLVKREKINAKLNEKRTGVNDFEPGQLVLVADKRKPPKGKSRQMWTPFYHSPFYVMASASHAVTVSRVVDSYTLLLPPTWVKHIREKSKMFESLPSEIQKFLGGPITPESLANLSKHDKLSLIYSDEFVPNFEPYILRSNTKERKRTRKVLSEIFEDPDEASEEDDDETILRSTKPLSPDQSKPADRGVSFGPITYKLI